MKIFPAVHYSMGGLWVDYERTAEGGLRIGSPRNQQTNVPGIFAIGECDYQYHGANRLGANSLVACIFSGLVVAPGIVAMLESLSGRPAAEQPSSLYDRAVREHQAGYKALLDRTGEGENPYLLHQQLGKIMTETATVVRHNDDLDEAYAEVSELQAAGGPLPALGHRQLDQPERDLHPGPAGHVPPGQDDPQGGPGAGRVPRGPLQAGVRHARASTPPTRPSGAVEAEAWCDRFEENNRKWLKSTIAVLGPDGEPQLSYEDVDTSLIPPRPRLYGLVGGEVIEQVWKERMTKVESQAT